MALSQLFGGFFKAELPLDMPKFLDMHKIGLQPQLFTYSFLAPKREKCKNDPQLNSFNVPMVMLL